MEGKGQPYKTEKQSFHFLSLKITINQRSIIYSLITYIDSLIYFTLITYKKTMNSIQKPQSWSPRRVQGPRINQSDRFIPSRIAIDLEAARLKLRNNTSEELSSSPSKVNYRKALSLCLFDTPDVLSQNTGIFKLQSKVPRVQKNVYAYLEDVHDVQEKIKVKPCKQRYISQSAERTLDAPNILDDYYLNLLDWSSTNKVSIALGQKVYIWDAVTSAAVELFSVDDDVGPITSVSWTANGGYLAAGMNNSEVQLWDHNRGKRIRSIRGNGCRVGSMAWNGNLLTTGNMDGLIVNHDVRIRDSAVQEYRGHMQEVCGLKWSPSGQFLASGGNDNLVHIWDRNMASVNLLGRNTTQYMHRLSDHIAAVKALAWCPFQNNLLATGGGSADRCIKFWNGSNGACLNSVDTESQVCALVWNRHERELLSSHGYSQNQLTLWKYPSMTKITELTGHTSRVLHLAESPDGTTVASAAGDERLRFWQVFGNPGTKKPKQREPVPMSHYAHIR